MEGIAAGIKAEKNAIIKKSKKELQNKLKELEKQGDDLNVSPKMKQTAESDSKIKRETNTKIDKKV